LQISTEFIAPFVLDAFGSGGCHVLVCKSFVWLVMLPILELCSGQVADICDIQEISN
jgi:hypothetical protein